MKMKCEHHFPFLHQTGFLKENVLDVGKVSEKVIEGVK